VVVFEANYLIKNQKIAIFLNAIFFPQFHCQKQSFGKEQTSNPTTDLDI
jgi:hypothetical protein